MRVGKGGRGRWMMGRRGRPGKGRVQIWTIFFLRDGDVESWPA